MEKILIATHNKGKANMFRKILQDRFEVCCLSDLGIEMDVIEDKQTFKQNAIKKAVEIYEKVKMKCIADDSGLCIDELEGFPGVKTARFLGENATQEERNNYILEKMKGLPKQRRRAKAVIAVAYCNRKRRSML